MLFRTILLMLLLPLLLAVGCDEGGRAEESAEVVLQEQEMARMDVAPTEQAAAPVPRQQVQPRLIKTADVRMEVEDYAEARAEVGAVAERYEAYVASEEERRLPSRIQNTLSLRVPAGRFDEALNALADVATDVEARTVEVRDVTEEFVDVQARLRARRAVEARYLDLLEQARTVEDILRVEQSLQSVREEVEQAEGRLNYLENRIGYSTITLHLYEPIPGGAIASGPGFFEQAARAFANGWGGLKLLALGLINLWPLLLLIALAALAARAYRQRRRTARAKAT